MFCILGVKNLRILHEGDYDTTPLTEHDFEEREIPYRFTHILSPVPSVHKQYIIENCKLAKIGNDGGTLCEDVAKKVQERGICLPCKGHALPVWNRTRKTLREKSLCGAAPFRRNCNSARLRI